MSEIDLETVDFEAVADYLRKRFKYCSTEAFYHTRLESAIAGYFIEHYTTDEIIYYQMRDGHFSKAKKIFHILCEMGLIKLNSTSNGIKTYKIQ